MRWLINQNIQKSILTILIIALVIIVFVIVYSYCLPKHTYILNLPAIEDIKDINIISDEKTITISEYKEIIKIYEIIKINRQTTEESIQDTPINSEETVRINFNFKTSGTSTIFLYNKDNKYFIEQPYNGIYRILREEYNEIREIQNN